MLKSFIELYNLDVRDYIKERIVTGKVMTEYIPWQDMVLLLHKNGAESVKYGNIYAEDGHSLFLKNGKCPEVHIFVEIDGDRREATYPLIKGCYAIDAEKVTQLDISNATQRAFVKCVSTNWGLGLSIWRKEEEAVEKNAPKDLSAHSLGAIRERLNLLVSSKLQMGYSMDDLYEITGFDKATFDAVKSYFVIINKLEVALQKITKRKQDDDHIA